MTAEDFEWVEHGDCELPNASSTTLSPTSAEPSGPADLTVWTTGRHLSDVHTRVAESSSAPSTIDRRLRAPIDTEFPLSGGRGRLVIDEYGREGTFDVLVPKIQIFDQYGRPGLNEFSAIADPPGYPRRAPSIGHTFINSMRVSIGDDDYGFSVSGAEIALHRLIDDELGRADEPFTDAGAKRPCPDGAEPEPKLPRLA